MFICIICINFFEKFYAVYFCSGQSAYHKLLLIYKIAIWNLEQVRQIHSNSEISRKATPFYGFMTFIMPPELKNLSELLTICSE